MSGVIDVGLAVGGAAVPAETCAWLLAVPEGDELRVTFSWLHLEDAGAPSDCVSTYVELSSPTVPARRACGTDVDLAPAVASGENITVGFVTDGVAAGSGFELQYHRYQRACWCACGAYSGAVRDPHETDFCACIGLVRVRAPAVSDGPQFEAGYVTAQHTNLRSH